jgi:ABC-type glycerol-3-phosphate transport system substrate-binding protein
MKKLISLSLVLLFSFTILFTGCGNKKDSNTIVIWHWMTDRDDAFIELANRYKQLYGIDVRFELYAPSEAYASKVKAAAQTDTLPDIYGILSEARDFASFIKAGHVEDLTGEMEASNSLWKNKLFLKALAVNEFLPDNQFGVKPGIYGVPIDVTNIQMVYNKKLFKQAGLDPNNPPKTWQEFMQVGAKLKKAGIEGLVSGWGEIWMLDCLASNYAFNVMGKDKVVATIKGDVPYTDPDWIKVLSLFKEMADNGILAKGVVTMVNKTAEQMFANERAAIAFNGSWCVNVYYGMNPNLDYGVMVPPKISDKYPMVTWGGAGSSFIVNAKSKNKAEAIKFLKWITDTDQQIFLAEATRNIPVNRDSLSAISPVLAQFAANMDKTTHPRFLPYSEFPSVIEAFDKGIQSIIIGEKTPQEVAKEVQELKQIELKRAKNTN